MKTLTTEQKRYLLKILQAGEREERELMQVLEIKNIVANHRIIFENYRESVISGKRSEAVKVATLNARVAKHRESPFI